ncbi:hypothetical protein [Streptomyces sp. NPDC002054]|uniref:hypothetical protein n=1 Tax=Streptomyces sp. NPDC002054 TaxID=3154663 RepID=UPI00332ACEA6
MEIDYKRQGGVTTVPLHPAEDVVLLPVVRTSVDWRAVHRPREPRSPPAALALLVSSRLVSGQDWVLPVSSSRAAGPTTSRAIGLRRRRPVVRGDVSAPPLCPPRLSLP